MPRVYIVQAVVSEVNCRYVAVLEAHLVVVEATVFNLNELHFILLAQLNIVVLQLYNGLFEVNIRFLASLALDVHEKTVINVLPDGATLIYHVVIVGYLIKWPQCIVGIVEVGIYNGQTYCCMLEVLVYFLL